jgi:hypothetical protein
MEEMQKGGALALNGSTAHPDAQPELEAITNCRQPKKDRCLLHDSGPSVSFVQRGRQRRSIRTACRT